MKKWRDGSFKGNPSLSGNKTAMHDGMRNDLNVKSLTSGGHCDGVADGCAGGGGGGSGDCTESDGWGPGGCDSSGIVLGPEVCPEKQYVAWTLERHRTNRPWLAELMCVKFIQ